MPGQGLTAAGHGHIICGKKREKEGKNVSFQVALSNVLLTILYILPGYALCKAKKAAPEHLSTLSAVLVYVCSPCLTLSSFLGMTYRPEDLEQMGLFFLAALALQGAFMLLLYLVFRRKYGDARYRLLTLGAAMGNAGFFGLPIVRALMPDNPEVLCYAVIFGLAMNILMFSMGVFLLTRDKKFVSLRAALINPAVAAVLVALPLYVIGARNCMPAMLVNALQLLGNMTTPLCMIILGIRLATVPLRQLFGRPFMYGICLMKLLVFPLFAFVCVCWLPLPLSFRASVLILSAAPCASYILNMAEIHHAETALAANCVLVSTLICFLTIPLMTFLL